jgi:hypothetical protein
VDGFHHLLVRVALWRLLLGFLRLPEYLRIYPEHAGNALLSGLGGLGTQCAREILQLAHQIGPVTFIRVRRAVAVPG